MSIPVPHHKFEASPVPSALSIPELYDWHYENDPAHPVFIYTDSRNGSATCTYRDLVPAIHRAGHLIAKATGLSLNANCDAYPTVAILATADTVTTFTLLLGMLRLGVKPFPISPRFSAAVIAHLLAKANVEYVLVSTESHIRKLAADSVETLRRTETSPRIPKVLDIPQYEDLYVPQAPFARLPGRVYDPSATSMLVHSSSSTSIYPKVVQWTTRMNTQTSREPLHSRESLTGQVFGCHGLELFHAFGLMFLFWLPTSGLTMAVFRPSNPAVVPTSDSVFRGITSVCPRYGVASTRFLEEWSRDSGKISAMKGMRSILYAGKILSKVAGDRLAGQDVSLTPIYGSTETGQISAVPSEPQGRDYEYFQLNSQCDARFLPVGDGSYHVVVVPSSLHSPSMINMELEGSDAYSTGDLAIPHPQRSGLWKILGRADDQIMLASGEVVSPVSIEDMLKQHRRVQAAVLFGRARPCLGVLLELKPEFSISTDASKLSAFRDDFWPFVEKINDSLPLYSRLTREMILLSDPNKPLEYTVKGSPKLPMVLLQYQAEIDGLYGSPSGDPLQTDKAPITVNVDVQMKEKYLFVQPELQPLHLRLFIMVGQLLRVISLGLFKL